MNYAEWWAPADAEIDGPNLMLERHWRRAYILGRQWVSAFGQTAPGNRCIMAVAEATGAAHSPFATSLGQTPASVNTDVPSAGQAVLVCVLGTSAMTTRDWHYAGMPTHAQLR